MYKLSLNFLSSRFCMLQARIEILINDRFCYEVGFSVMFCIISKALNTRFIKIKAYPTIVNPILSSFSIFSSLLTQIGH